MTAIKIRVDLAESQVLDDLHAKGRLTPSRAYVAHRFLSDWRQAGGSSAGLVGMYGERVSRTTAPLGPPRGANEAHERLQRIIDKLCWHERMTINYILTPRERHRPGLEHWGAEVSGYKDRAMAIGAAVARIQALLDTLGECGYGAA